MFCPACGATVVQDVRFCAKCGAQVIAASPQQYAAYPPVVPPYLPFRVQRHLQALGSLWLVFGLYRLATGLMGLFFFRAMTMHGWFGGGFFGDPFRGSWMHTFFPLVVTTVIAMSTLSLLAAYGLMTRQPWGRMLAIIVAIISLVKIPFGTVLGVYTLWVLVPSESGTEYEAIVQRS